ncbi:MAG: RloB domain-containing protein [Candidatus Omnitrophica bacterium]|nr:RloB domain-containing protein [Candidatus Omnitrophota bacterium]
MGTDNLFHKKKREVLRKLASRNAKQRILIVCEGEQTEPNYFKAFPITSVEVKVIGDGFNTKSLVKFTKTKSAQAKREKLPFFQVWCVFDRDSFSKEHFNAAIQMAESAGFKVAFSNEAFELWYLLHFEYLTAGIDRSQYKSKLSKLLGKEYRKNSIDMYDCLLSKQDVAIKHAKKLLGIHHDRNPADMTPSTTVHLLVEELNKLVVSS